MEAKFWINLNTNLAPKFLLNNSRWFTSITNSFYATSKQESEQNNSNKCMSHLLFTNMFRMFRSNVSVVICKITYVWLGCLMMHDMHDLQCLNAGITPGCYTHSTLRCTEEVFFCDSELHSFTDEHRDYNLTPVGDRCKSRLIATLLTCRVTRDLLS